MTTKGHRSKCHLRNLVGKWRRRANVRNVSFVIVSFTVVIWPLSTCLIPNFRKTNNNNDINVDLFLKFHKLNDLKLKRKNKPHARNWSSKWTFKVNSVAVSRIQSKATYLRGARAKDVWTVCNVILSGRSGASFSKVLKIFRAQKAIRKTPTLLFWKAGLSCVVKGIKIKITASFRASRAFVLQIQRELCHP